MLVDYTVLPFASFPEVAFGALVGKEGYPVEIAANQLTGPTSMPAIQILNAGIYIGDLFEHLEGSTAWKVQLRGYICKGIAAVAITAPSYVVIGATGLSP